MSVVLFNNKILLRIYYVLGTVLYVGDRVVNKIVRVFWCLEGDLLLDKVRSVREECCKGLRVNLVMCDIWVIFRRLL